MNNIPTDVLRLIAKRYLPDIDLSNLVIVNRRWQKIVDQIATKDPDKTMIIGAHDYVGQSIELGYFDVLKWSTNGYKYLKQEYTDIAAAKSNDPKYLKIFQILVDHGCPIGFVSGIYVAKYGYFDLLKQLYADGMRINHITASWAAESGHFEIVKWFLTIYTLIDTEDFSWIWEHAAAGNSPKHLEILEWLHINNVHRGQFTGFFAARHGHLNILKYLDGIGVPLSDNLCKEAARQGHLDILEWLYSKDPTLIHNNWVCSEAVAFQENPDKILRWLYEHGAPINERTMANAACYGNHKIIEWLYSIQSITQFVCEEAARGDQLEILEWISEKFPPKFWNAETSMWLAYRGNLKTLQWAIENGAPWNESTYVLAADYDLTILKWLKSVDLNNNFAKVRDLNFISRITNPEILEWYLNVRNDMLTLSMSEIVTIIIKCSNLKTLEWALNNLTFPIDETHFKAAKNKPKVTKLLNQVRV
jgi:hypothetical protein